MSSIPQPDDTAGPPRPEAPVEELRRLLEAGGADVEKAVAAHPWLALSAAFLLGLCIGRGLR